MKIVATASNTSKVNGVISIYNKKCSRVKYFHFIFIILLRANNVMYFFNILCFNAIPKLSDTVVKLFSMLLKKGKTLLW